MQLIELGEPVSPYNFSFLASSDQYDLGQHSMKQAAIAGPFRSNLEVAYCHFHVILLNIASHQTSSDSLLTNLSQI